MHLTTHLGELAVDGEGGPGGTALTGTAGEDEDENNTKDTWSND